MPDCQVDVVCSEANRYSNAVRSVAHIKVTGTDGTTTGTWMCSGALINNTRLDRRPYFLTAYHCGGTGDQDRDTWWNGDKASSVRFYWRHHSDYCGQRLEERQLRLANWQSGARFVAGNLDNDFTLLELTRPVLASSTYRQHFAGWNRSPNRYAVVAGIHHPDGEAKSIAFDQRGPYGANVYPRWNATENEWWWSWNECSSGANCDGLIVYWDEGSTFGGSSGVASVPMACQRDHRSSLGEPPGAVLWRPRRPRQELHGLRMRGGLLGRRRDVGDKIARLAGPHQYTPGKDCRDRRRTRPAESGRPADDDQ